MSAKDDSWKDAAYWAHVQRVVDAAPPLSPTQISRLRTILAPAVAKLTAEAGEGGAAA